MAVIRPSLPQLAFTMIPNAWARDGELRPNAKAVLMSVLSHAEGYRLSTAQIMRETGLGRDGVDAAIDHMLARGYLVGVEQRQGERGRFGENDYTITDCTDRVPPIPSDPPKRGRKVRNGPQRSETATVPDRCGAAPPHKKNTLGEDQEEQKINPAAAATGGDGDGELDLIEAAPTVDQRAQALARAHYDAVGGLVSFQGVMGIAKRALSVTEGDGHPRYTDERVAAALGLLREAGRPVTLQTLHAALETPHAVAPRSYAASGARARIPTDPDEHRGLF